MITTSLLPYTDSPTATSGHDAHPPYESAITSLTGNKDYWYWVSYHGTGLSGYYSCVSMEWRSYSEASGNTE